ncbi:MAG: VOC family protein [Pseudomonadota bacterium]
MVELMVDHVLILHDDLELGALAASRLGFRPTPTGHHGQGMGTANTTLMMPDRATYIELLTVTEATEKSAPMRAAMDARGEPHIFGIALKGEAEAAAAHFAQAGISGGPAFGFSRPVDLSGESAEARFSIALMAGGAIPGLHTFVCQHHARDVTWRPDFLDQPNTAQALLSIEGQAADLDEIAASWSRMMGRPAKRDGGDVLIETGTANVRYRQGVGAPILTLLRFAVSDLQKTRACLAGNGVVFTAEGDEIQVSDELGLGVAIAFAAV